MNRKTPKNSRGEDYTSYTRPLPLVSDINKLSLLLLVSRGSLDPLLDLVNDRHSVAELILLVDV